MKEQIKKIRFPFEIKAVTPDGIIEGYASTFNNIDLGGDKVMPGAFKRTLKNNGSKVPILADHRMDQQIGWNMDAKEDSSGLYVKGWLDINNNQKAKEKYSMAQKALEVGAKSGLSIGYAAVGWEIVNDKQTNMSYRKLKEIKLYEYSLVTFPMNEEASMTSAKGFDELFEEEINEAELLEKFVAKLKEKGCNESSIKSALERSAAKIESPSLRHLFDEGIKNLKSK